MGGDCEARGVMRGAGVAARAARGAAETGSPSRSMCKDDSLGGGCLGEREEGEGMAWAGTRRVTILPSIAGCELAEELVAEEGAQDPNPPISLVEAGAEAALENAAPPGFTTAAP